MSDLVLVPELLVLFVDSPRRSLVASVTISFVIQTGTLLGANEGQAAERIGDALLTARSPAWVLLPGARALGTEGAGRAHGCHAPAWLLTHPVTHHSEETDGAEGKTRPGRAKVRGHQEHPDPVLTGPLPASPLEQAFCRAFHGAAPTPHCPSLLHPCHRAST